MIINVILGYTVDTKAWIYELRSKNAENIIVVDYDYLGEPTIANDIKIFSVYDAKMYLESYDSINFYKSLYGYPGMTGKMNSLFKNQ